MRTTIELPDQLLALAKSRAALAGSSLKEFFVEAVEEKLSSGKQKTRRPPPVIGRKGGRRIGLLTPEQRDEAMFG
jgi:hypothetical protein